MGMHNTEALGARYILDDCNFRFGLAVPTMTELIQRWFDELDELDPEWWSRDIAIRITGTPLDYGRLVDLRLAPRRQQPVGIRLQGMSRARVEEILSEPGVQVKQEPDEQRELPGLGQE